MAPKICIEVCGLPASGKTFMLEQVNYSKLKKLKTEEMYSYVVDKSRLKRNLLTIYYIFSNPLIISILLLYGMRLSGKRNLYPLKRAFLGMKFLMIYDHVYKKEKKTYLIDQGIVQFIWSLSSMNQKKGSRGTKILRLLLKLLIRKYNFVVIHYKVSPILAAQRAISRKSNCVFDNLDEDLVKYLYSIHANDFEIILSYLPNDKGVTVNSISDFERVVMEYNK